MGKILAVVLGMVVVSIAISALTGAQSGSKQRTPALTTDDLRSSPRGVSPAPADNETQTRAPKNSDVGSGTIAWHRDLRSAFDVARSEGKVVIADVYTDWCGWCKRMDQTIYSDPAIVALSREQIFVKVNAEDGGQGERFAQEMRVRGYPTTIILDGQGRVLDVARGYIESPRAFGKMVQEAKAQSR